MCQFFVLCLLLGTHQRNAKQIKSPVQWVQAKEDQAELEQGTRRKKMQEEEIMALPPPKVRYMSNGMPVDLYVAVQKLRIYGVILLAASLFFLGWSIISYFIAEPLMAFYGMGSFGCSTLTAIFFLTNRIATSGWKGRLNVVCTHLANSGYFAVAALYGHNVSYGRGWTITAGILFGCWILAAAISYNILCQAQRIMDRTEDDGEDALEDIERDLRESDLRVRQSSSTMSGSALQTQQNMRIDSLSFGDV